MNNVPTQPLFRAMTCNLLPMTGVLFWEVLGQAQSEGRRERLSHYMSHSSLASESVCHVEVASAPCNWWCRGLSGMR